MSGAAGESAVAGDGAGPNANGLTWRGLGLCAGAMVAFFGALLPYGLMFHPVLWQVSFWLGWACLIGFTWTTVAAARGCRDIRRVGWHIGTCLVFLLAMVCGLWEPRDPERGVVVRGLLSVAIIAILVRCVWLCPGLPWRVRRAASAWTVAALIGVSFLSLAGPMASLRGGFHSPQAETRVETRVAFWLALLGGVCVAAVVVPWVLDTLVKRNSLLAKKRPEGDRCGAIASSTKWLMTGALIVVVGLLAGRVFFMPGTCMEFSGRLGEWPMAGAAGGYPPEAAIGYLQSQGFRQFVGTPSDLFLAEEERPLAILSYPITDGHPLIITLYQRKQGVAVNYQYRELSVYEAGKAKRLLKRLHESLQEEARIGSYARLPEADL